MLRAIEPHGRASDIRRDVVRGQYGPGWVGGDHVPGYREEPEVDRRVDDRDVRGAQAARSTNWRWADVPFYLRTGKRLPKRATEIAIQFKRPPAVLFREADARSPSPNLLALRIQPDEGIMLRFAAKVPGLGLDVRSVNMDFTYGSSFSVEAPEAYETLILDALLGRRLAVHPRRRGRGGVVDRHPARPAVGGVGQARRQRRSGHLRGGHLGSGRRRSAPRARRPPLAPALTR